MAYAFAEYLSHLVKSPKQPVEKGSAPSFERFLRRSGERGPFHVLNRSQAANMAGFLLELVGNDENLCRYRVLQQEDYMEEWDPRDLRHHQV